MGNTPPNPYFNLAMIRNVEMFFGRNMLLRRFYTDLANHQSVSILGQRRMGKSSFLWCASLPATSQRFSAVLDRHIFIFLDLHDYLHKTSEDFFHSVSDEIISQSSRVMDLPPHITETHGAAAFTKVLDQISRQGFFPVLLLDSFDKVTLNEHFGPEFFGFLRSQASRGRISYVTASIRPLYEVCHRGIEGSPFFNIFHNYTLEALTSEEADALITEPAANMDLPFDHAEVALIRDLAGRHPFFLQRVCYAFFEEKISLQDTPESTVHQTRLRRQLYHELYPHFQDVWGQLPEKLQTQLRYKFQHKDESKLLPELSESSLFRQFVSEDYHKDLFKLSQKDLEEALEKLHDPQQLGEVKLCQMQSIAQHLEKTTLSNAERGLIIRDVLREALERLRASSVRSDSAPEWLTYNILYYRYFQRHNMTNEQLAARLPLGSVRQFYRERTRAIGALYTILLEMERSVISAVSE